MRRECLNCNSVLYTVSQKNATLFIFVITSVLELLDPPRSLEEDKRWGRLSSSRQYGNAPLRSSPIKRERYSNLIMSSNFANLSKKHTARTYRIEMWPAVYSTFVSKSVGHVPTKN